MSCRGRRRTLVALVLFGILVAGCAEGTDRTSEATALAERYLAAVAGGSDDRGWSLLHPDARRDMFGDNAEQYVNAVVASDWTGFRFSVESVVPDDPSLYIVELSTNPPGFLVQAWGGNLRIVGNAAPDGMSTMAIRFETFATGVWPYGG